MDKDEKSEKSWGAAPARFAVILLTGLLLIVMAALLLMPRASAGQSAMASPSALASDVSAIDEALITSIWDNPLAAPQVQIPAEGLLQPDDATFMVYFDQLYEEKQRYYGREIEVAGIVLLDEDLATDEFLLGRNLVWCCANDTYFVGFLAFGLQSLPEDGSSWRIRGWLEPRLYTDPETGRSFNVPAIRVNLATPDSAFSVDIYQLQSD